ncbi:hypothetical protein EJ110_NYTH41620 [Nymphaea thermarum]|nr:hypothetical protein EJ110_NYTH41620 [Nymphaea thermarum]
MPQCIPSLDKLRNLMDKLRIVDLRLLTYKKKLAFWINTYNACIMHAFLHYGLPSTMDKLLALMNKIRVYTAENVMNELDNAKTEYLHASIEVTIKKRVVLPKLLYCTDFANNLESLLEWIYDSTVNLPRTTSLRKSIMDCLKGERKWLIQKMVQLQSYVSEFRYILHYLSPLNSHVQSKKAARFCNPSCTCHFQ